MFSKEVICIFGFSMAEFKKNLYIMEDVMRGPEEFMVIMKYLLH